MLCHIRELKEQDRQLRNPRPAALRERRAP
jgi:hypothetical protein